MNLPQPGDYIDIHDHDVVPAAGKFSVENLLANESSMPDLLPGVTYSIGLHPWNLSAGNIRDQLERVRQLSGHSNVAAIGEAGFDRLKGPGMDLQREAFVSQVEISESVSKPLFIHCVRSWEELVSSRIRLKPKMPWIIHGFRGKKELALQLISKDMYISFWFDFIIRPESSQLVKNLPVDRIFLETDGSGADICEIYKKVASDMGLGVEELKEQIADNFKSVFCM